MPFLIICKLHTTHRLCLHILSLVYSRPWFTVCIQLLTQSYRVHINACIHSTDPPTLSDLIEHVGSCCSTKWYNLGLRLGVNTHTLDEIEEDCQKKCSEACRKMFQAWLREKRGGTWNDVILALSSRSVGEGGVADELEAIINT